MITKFGRQKLEEHLHQLQGELERTLEERSRAAAEGDLRENSAYLFLGERADVLRSQIAEVTQDLQASVVQAAPEQNVTIAFGHQVSLRYLADNREITLVLVGKNDARLQPNWISLESPLGQALLGHHLGDKVEVNGQKILILSIEKGAI
ncbi:GreA/GreB family elongation factor [Patescibacteria group bacterium]|nr:GreA/GreB family elongation factor [Patescibacteria group bacterium]